MERSAEQQSFSQAIARLLDAGQRLVIENLRLARYELDFELGWWARHGVWFAAAMATAVAAWALLSIGLVLVLSAWAGLVAAVLLGGALNLLAGVLLFGVGLRQLARRRAAASQAGATRDQEAAALAPPASPRRRGAAAGK